MATKGAANSQEPLSSLSASELKSLSKSMKRPEFMSLLSEYLMQISDPKNKAEHDAYLLQLQDEGQLPAHMQLVKLQAQFCVRTHIVESKNKKHEMKVFINLCSTNLIAKPEGEVGEGGGVGWKVPNAMGKLRYDRDRDDKPCQVVDIGFNPECFMLSAHLPPFQSLLISIALESLTRLVADRQQTISKDYVILKKLKAKGGEPALLPMRVVDGKGCNPDGVERSNEGKKTKLEKELDGQKKPQPSATIPEEAEQIQDIEDEGAASKALVAQVSHPSGVQQPRYSLIYSYPVDYSQFMAQPGQVSHKRQRPTHVSVEIKLDRIVPPPPPSNVNQESTEQTNGSTLPQPSAPLIPSDCLNVSSEKLLLDIPQMYYLDLAWAQLKGPVRRYGVRMDDARAKWDKKKRILRVKVALGLVQLEGVQPEELRPQNEALTNKSSQIVDQQQSETAPLIKENQTWKRKVLQFSPINQSIHTIPSEAAKQTEEEQAAPKILVETICEDDVEEQNQDNETDHKNKKQMLIEKKVRLSPFSMLAPPSIDYEVKLNVSEALGVHWNGNRLYSHSQSERSSNQHQGPIKPDQTDESKLKEFWPQPAVIPSTFANFEAVRSTCTVESSKKYVNSFIFQTTNKTIPQTDGSTQQSQLLTNYLSWFVPGGNKSNLTVKYAWINLKSMTNQQTNSIVDSKSQKTHFGDILAQLALNKDFSKPLGQESRLLIILRQQIKSINSHNTVGESNGNNEQKDIQYIYHGVIVQTRKAQVTQSNQQCAQSLNRSHEPKIGTTYRVGVMTVKIDWQQKPLPIEKEALLLANILSEEDNHKNRILELWEQFGNAHDCSVVPSPQVNDHKEEKQQRNEGPIEEGPVESLATPLNEKTAPLESAEPKQQQQIEQNQVNQKLSENSLNASMGDSQVPPVSGQPQFQYFIFNTALIDVIE